MKVKFFDLKITDKKIKQSLIKRFSLFLDKGNFFIGPEVFKLEKLLAKKNNSKYCVCLSSGSSALYLALKAAGVKRGDEVITSGGIIGIVERVMEDDRIEVMLGDSVKVQIIKSTITSLLKKTETK